MIIRHPRCKSRCQHHQGGMNWYHICYPRTFWNQTSRSAEYQCQRNSSAKRVFPAVICQDTIILLEVRIKGDRIRELFHPVSMCQDTYLSNSSPNPAIHIRRWFEPGPSVSVGFGEGLEVWMFGGRIFWV